jgi:hypothetical protein
MLVVSLMIAALFRTAIVQTRIARRGLGSQIQASSTLDGNDYTVIL